MATRKATWLIKPGWKLKGLGDFIPWTVEELADRKINKDAAMKKREEIMENIRAANPDDA